MKLPEQERSGGPVNHRVGVMAFAVWMLLAGSAKRSDAEDTTASFLKIPASARSASLGGAAAARPYDALSVFSNPAGLTGLGRQFAASDARLFADTRYDTFAYAQPLRPGSLGVSVGYLSQGAIEARSADRSRGGSFSASDMVIGVSYARPVWAGASLGGTVKMIRSQIAGVRASGWAVDVGGQFSTGVEGLSLGLSARNLGPGMTFLSEKSRLPSSLSAGLSCQAGALNLVADVSRQLAEEKSSFALGVELPVLSALTVRGGYAKGAAALVPKGGQPGLAAGLGLRVLGAQVDYAFTPMGELGNAQRIGLSTRF